MFALFLGKMHDLQPVQPIFYRADVTVHPVAKIAGRLRGPN
jgi:hypothetical protein